MAKGKLLFIDDDNFLRKVYQAELVDKGFDVTLAVDGADGLEKVAASRPDLIILDLIMPKKNGFEVLADLQRYEDTRSIPVIVLSNLAQSEDQKRALDLGAVDYLVKDNTTLDIIAEKIEQHLSKVRNGHTAAPAEQSLSGELKRRKETEAENTPSQESMPKGTAATPPASSRTHNFCSSCGTKVKKEDKFCPNCGARMD
ncbi:MAG: hypothetical protein A3B30_02555 [Candidatus Komeilibacteria bacterium RIFCSPLOWO2_01_FULL_52_15]|nr:MAG: hypothetical protein A3B30_02555 [Candidatus Komeilibacteria bacterium RIFCSPLOWO2_01_FULL_52_15]